MADSPTPQRGKPSLSWGEALKSDFPASIIVFLVALPLCMGIAIASGAPPATGLITGIVGGIFVGLIAGSPLQVSGPAAGLFVLVKDVIDQFAEGGGNGYDLERGLTAMGLAVLIAGAIQLTAGLLRFGGYFRAVSPAVIQGMLSGIGVLILASQFHVMVDDKAAAKPYLEQGYTKGVANLISIPQSFLKGIVPTDYQYTPHFQAAAIGVGTILILAFWKLIPVKQLKIIPAPVIAVTLASAVAYFLGLTLPPKELEQQDKAAATVAEASIGGVEAGGGESEAEAGKDEKAGKPDAPVVVDGRVRITQVRVPDDLTQDIRTPSMEDLREVFGGALLVSAITIALVASAETMLCAAAVDQMQTHARTNYDRELAAQGVGNLVCGYLGALPMTGVIVRSSANVDSGGRTRLSAFLHGVWLLLFVAALPWLLNYIPMASLAAVLVFTGWKLINFKAIARLWKVNRAEGIICLTTLALVVGVDLLRGVIAGIVMAAVRLLVTFAKLDVNVISGSSEEEPPRVEFHLRGAATFLALPKLTAMLDEIEPETELHVHLEELTYVDHACLELFVNWEKQHAASGGKLVIDWDDLTATFQNQGTGTYPARAKSV